MGKLKTNRKLIVAMVAMMLVTGGTAFALLTSQTVVPSAGIIVVVQPPPPPATIGLEVFSDAACTAKVTKLDWGVLNPGSTGRATVYLMNTGNTDGRVTMAPANWNPAGTKDIAALTWDGEGVAIGAGKAVQANLTLVVSGSVTGISEFAFDIVFTIEG